MSAVKLKICGVMSVEDALCLADTAYHSILLSVRILLPP